MHKNLDPRCSEVQSNECSQMTDTTIIYCSSMQQQTQEHTNEREARAFIQTTLEPAHRFFSMSCLTQYINQCEQNAARHKAAATIKPHKRRKVYICIAQVTRVQDGTNRQHVRTLRAVAHLLLHYCCSDHCHNTTRSYPVPHDCIAVVTAVLIGKLKRKVCSCCCSPWC
jgi:hypothetical protein